MPSFNPKSQERLDQCHQDLRALFQEVVKYYDCTVICGFRSELEQEEAFKTGKTKVHYPDSKHNNLPSLAADVVPYPIDWNDRNRFYHFAGFVRGVAERMGIKIRWGGDWNGNFDLKDQNFFDLPHFELVTTGDKNAGTE